METPSHDAERVTFVDFKKQVVLKTREVALRLAAAEWAIIGVLRNDAALPDDAAIITFLTRVGVQEMIRRE